MAALERRMLAGRCFAHCHHQDVVCRGRANGLRRFHCLACGKTFNALTGTPLARPRHKERWFEFAHSLSAREVVRRSAVRRAIATSTAFRWRHRFLQAIKTDAARLRGTAEADETCILQSRKGLSVWKQTELKQPAAQVADRKPRKRGLSREQVPVLMATDRSGATVSIVLARVNADARATVLARLLSKDALLVTDSAVAFPPCAKQLGVTHEVLNQSADSWIRRGAERASATRGTDGASIRWSGIFGCSRNNLRHCATCHHGRKRKRQEWKVKRETANLERIAHGILFSSQLTARAFSGMTRELVIEVHCATGSGGPYTRRRSRHHRACSA